MNCFPTSSPVLAERARETHIVITQETSQLSPTAQDTVFLGVWSVKDLITHLIGWDYVNLAAAKDIQAGKLPEFYVHSDKP